MLADEDNNLIDDGYGNAVHVGTYIESTGQYFPVPRKLARDIDAGLVTVPTKQIGDFELDDVIQGTEDILIQDNGVTKRVKVSDIVADYYTRSEIDDKLSVFKPVDLVANSVIFQSDKTTTDSLGGIPAGSNLNNMSIQQVLDKLLFPYVPPQISGKLNYTPSGSVFECGQTVTLTNMTATITKQSDKITSVKFLFGSGVLQDVTVGVDGSATYKFLFPKPVEIKSNLASNAYRVSVTDASGNTYYANTNGITFYYPYYMGSIEDGVEITSELIVSLSKRIEGKGTKVHNYTTNYQRMVIAYPASYGPLSRILDANSFDVTGTFTSVRMGIIGLDETRVDYYIYSNSPSTMSNFRMTFYH